MCLSLPLFDSVSPPLTKQIGLFSFRFGRSTLTRTICRNAWKKRRVCLCVLRDSAFRPCRESQWDDIRANTSGNSCIYILLLPLRCARPAAISLYGQSDDSATGCWFLLGNAAFILSGDCDKLNCQPHDRRGETLVPAQLSRPPTRRDQLCKWKLFCPSHSTQSEPDMKCEY